MLKQECESSEGLKNASADRHDALQGQLSASTARKQSLLQQIASMEDSIAVKEKQLKKAK